MSRRALIRRTRPILRFAPVFLVALAVVPSRATAAGALAQSAVKVPKVDVERLQLTNRVVHHPPGSLPANSFYYIPGGWVEPEWNTQVAGKYWGLFTTPVSMITRVGSHTWEIWWYGMAHPTDPELVCLTEVVRFETEWEGHDDPSVAKTYRIRQKPGPVVFEKTIPPCTGPAPGSSGGS